MKYKATVKETPHGLQLSLYKKVVIWWWIAGLKPLTVATFLLDEYLDRWKKMYGENLTVEDCRK